MNCPVCGKEMVEEDCGDVKIDICKDGCKGIWFDWGELSMLDEKNEGVGKALEEALNYPRINDENRPPITCPKCGMKMHSHKYKSSKEVNVDECYGCGGFFLDSGELKQIKDTHMSEQERKEYAQRLAEGMPAYQQKLATIAMRRKRNTAVKNFSSYLTKRRYFPMI